MIRVYRGNCFQKEYRRKMSVGGLTVIFGYCCLIAEDYFWLFKSLYGMCFLKSNKALEIIGFRARLEEILFTSCRIKKTLLSNGPSNRPINLHMSANQLAWLFSHFQLGKQEDAEEFLSCILDGMHEEMSAAVNLNTNNVDSHGRFNFAVNSQLPI